MNAMWKDDRIFFETRKIIIALIQHIAYDEWLPLVTGNNSLSSLKSLEYFTGYDSSVNFLFLILTFF